MEAACANKPAIIFVIMAEKSDDYDRIKVFSDSRKGIPSQVRALPHARTPLA